MAGTGFHDIELLRGTLEASVLGEVEVLLATCNACGTRLRAVRAGQSGLPQTFHQSGTSIRITCKCRQQATFDATGSV